MNKCSIQTKVDLLRFLLNKKTIRFELHKINENEILINFSSVYLRRFDWSNISCVDHPKSGYVFEWVNAKHYQVSRENILRIQMVKESDFGFYLCRPFDNMGPLPIKEVYILEDTSPSNVFATGKCFCLLTPPFSERSMPTDIVSESK